MPSGIYTLQKSWLKESGTTPKNEAAYGKNEALCKNEAAYGKNKALCQNKCTACRHYELELERKKALVETEKKRLHTKSSKTIGDKK